MFFRTFENERDKKQKKRISVKMGKIIFYLKTVSFKTIDILKRDKWDNMFTQTLINDRTRESLLKRKAQYGLLLIKTACFVKKV